MPRKANGEGTVEMLPSGKFRYKGYIEIDGVRQRKAFTADSPTAARKAFRDWLAQNDNKATIERSETIAQWGQHWLELYKKPFVSWKVGQDYQMYLNRHIIPAFGKLKLTDVRPAHITKLYAVSQNSQGKALSRSALNVIRITLNGIFETAIDNSLCYKNPAKRVPLPEEIKKPVKVFTQGQMDMIIEHLPKHPNGPYIAFLLYTGLRVGELLSLMWTDIDTEDKMIHVRRSLTRTDKGEVVGEHTKTKRERTVPYDKGLEPFLEQIPKSGLYVLCDKKGGTLSHRQFDTLYYHFFSDLNTKIKNSSQKLPRLTPHKCRHTFATYLLRGGVDIRVVQMILGHSTIRTTEIYTQVDTKDLKDNITKLPY